MSFYPSKLTLSKYADVMVNFGLTEGKKSVRGKTILLQVPESAKPMLVALRKAVLMAGAYPLIQYIPDDMARDFFVLANKSQLAFFPDKYLRGKIDQIDHNIYVIATSDKLELKGIDPKKIMTNNIANKPYMDWRDEKENKGKFTWTVCMYATDAMAKEAGMRLEAYWNEIIKACYLNAKDPVAKWKAVSGEINQIKNKLNRLQIESLTVKSKNTDLVVGIGKGRQWLGGGGANIPSFELFISPDARLTNGQIYFDQPLYRYGNLIENVSLEFTNGKVTKASATKGENTLLEMLKVEGANMIGEFSLTDARHSNITKFMAETLFDENRGGKYGNTHIALGSAYKDSYPGDASKVTKKKWQSLGYNESVIHADIVTTEDRVVTATLVGGKEKIIYEKGRFTV